MKYAYEQLNDESFQELCQSLILSEKENVQCLPVGQPDGGRDAIQRQGKDLVIYQVKFTRNPDKIEDPYEWFTNTIDDEKTKIETLNESYDISDYILITNIKGSAHLDVGKIDKIQKYLNEKMPVSSICWWRDDLDRRLDNNWNLKWVYPQILTGPDIIRSIIGRGLTERKEQRTNAINAYLRDEYRDDKTVKFKQIELQNDLLDLFTDVPISFSGKMKSKKEMNEIKRVFSKIIDEKHISDSILNFYSNDYQGANFGAANFLVRPLVQEKIKKIVIEGAPGQGKSTIVQFLCQLNRIRILNTQEDLEKINDNYLKGAVELPFKIDLRNFSTWLTKRNPFGVDSKEEVPENWQPTLESFMAASVERKSGGINFNVNDFISVAKFSSILIVLDGLDEVADLKMRRKVVEEISRSVERINANASSFRVIVTSRPTAFSNSPGLSSKGFKYFKLKSLTKELVLDYSEKWFEAKRIEESEKIDLKKILTRKLKLAHVKELSRNPMQLAILLSLIHTRGISLPEKRTALYDNYIELFFNREAEKDTFVRDNRDLLMNIHRYLAWILHSEVELGKSNESSNGRISKERLDQEIKKYLNKEGYESNILSDLFKGMVERVVVLVSRVEGTYEFEVQPLREYFAARFLYETAPYSPVGDEKGGTKPDRFLAIAKNPYWKNVTRFYAGCYSKGELGSLIDCINELQSDLQFSLVSYVQELALTLLSDWVFSQHPVSVKRVINNVINTRSLKQLSANRFVNSYKSDSISLSENCGKDFLIKKCLKFIERLDGERSSDYLNNILSVVKKNASSSQIIDIWTNLEKKYEDDIDTWLYIGNNLGVFKYLDYGVCNQLLHKYKNNKQLLSCLLTNQRNKTIELRENVFDESILYILNNSEVFYPRGNLKGADLLAIFGNALVWNRYFRAFSKSTDSSLSQEWKNATYEYYDLEEQLEKIETPNYGSVKKVKEVLNTIISNSSLPVNTWRSSIKPWDEIVEKIRGFWGDSKTVLDLALLSSTIKSKSETYSEYDDLFDESLSLCKRFRYARLRTGSKKWWKNTLKGTRSTNDKIISLLILFSWGSYKTINYNRSQIEHLLNGLSSENIKFLYNSLLRFSIVLSDNKNLKFEKDSISHFSPLLLAFLSIRTTKKSFIETYKRKLKSYNTNVKPINNMKQSAAFYLYCKEYDKQYLKDLSDTYSKGANSGMYYPFFRKEILMNEKKLLDEKHSEEILKDSEKYPSNIVAYTEEIKLNSMFKDVTPVAKISKEENWF